MKPRSLVYLLTGIAIGGLIFSPKKNSKGRKELAKKSKKYKKAFKESASKYKEKLAGFKEKADTTRM